MVVQTPKGVFVVVRHALISPPVVCKLKAVLVEIPTAPIMRLDFQTHKISFVLTDQTAEMAAFQSAPVRIPFVSHLLVQIQELIQL